MSLIKANTIKPVTSGADLSLQGDSGGSAVDCLNITSAGDVDFTGNTDAKIKLPSAGGLYESDGTTPVLTESGGVVTLGSAVVLGGGAGKILQVIKVQTNTAYNIGDQTTYYNMAAFDIEITPGDTANHVVYSISSGGAIYGAPTDVGIKVTRTIGAAETIVMENRSYVQMNAAFTLPFPLNLTIYDSPSTEEACTYKIYYKNSVATAASHTQINTNNTPTNSAQVIAMEVAE